MEYKNFDIVIVAGQSNAEGNGLGNIELKPILKDNVYMLVDEQIVFAHDFDGTSHLTCPTPTKPAIKKYEERTNDKGNTCGELATTFIYEYQNKCLESGRNILVIKTAIGGSGFFFKEWGLNNPLLNRFFDLVDYALTNFENSKIVALLWHQGEHDAFENTNAKNSLTTIYSEYKKNFKEQFDLIREKYGTNYPIIAGEFVEGWNKGYLKELNEVIKATNEVLDEYGLDHMIKTNDLPSNDVVTNNGDNIHFSRIGIYELGKRYFASFLKQKEN